MFFPYRGEIVPRVSKSPGHEAGTAHRALGRKLGSTGSHSWKPEQAELADTLQEDEMVWGCWVVACLRSLTFSREGPRKMLRASSMDWEGERFPLLAARLEKQRTSCLPAAGDLQSGSESGVTQVCAQPGRVISRLLFPMPPRIFLYASGLGGRGDSMPNILPPALDRYINGYFSFLAGPAPNCYSNFLLMD